MNFYLLTVQEIFLLSCLKSEEHFWACLGRGVTSISGRSALIVVSRSERYAQASIVKRMSEVCMTLSLCRG